MPSNVETTRSDGAVLEADLRAYLEYFRDLGIRDFYRVGEPAEVLEIAAAEQGLRADVEAQRGVQPSPPAAGANATASHIESVPQVLRPSDASPQGSGTARAPGTAPVISAPYPSELEPPIAKPVSFNDRAPLPEIRIAAAARPAALSQVREEIGDCTRCPLAYAGRHSIVFADGDPNARLMFVGEGPGADEDASGVPFVGKAGQLLNNMITAMGLKREQVYIANIVKCRPPGNRVPEPLEADTCSQFLLRQIDIVQPEVIVALGATAATYLLGVRQSLSSLRGRWHACRGARLLVTYHPAFLLRDPRQKGEAWKDLQMAMAHLGLKTQPKA